MSLPAFIRREITARTVSITEAVNEIPDGSRVFVGTGVGEPLALIDELSSLIDAKKLHLIFGFSLRPPPVPSSLLTPACVYLHVGYRQAADMEKGKIDWIPSSIENVAEWIRSGRLPIDVALIQVHPGDAHGQYSLGTSVDITKIAVETAKYVIAMVNPFVPRTHGQSFVDWRKIHRFVRREEPLLEVISRFSDAMVEEEIARNTMRVIPDGATLQLGFPRVPRQLLSRLATRQNLGVHSLLISDWVMELLENGNITNARKGVATGKVTASCALGSRRFYEYLHDSPVFDFQPIDRMVHYTSQNPDFMNIVDASAVDIWGRARFENSPFSRRLSAFLGNTPTVVSHAFTVVVLSSRDTQGNPAIHGMFSNSDIPGYRDAWPDAVVTEYGVALLRGKTASQRALELIALAHPDDRAELWETALARKRIAGPWKVSLHRNHTWTYSDQNVPEILVRMARAADLYEIVRFHLQLSPTDLQRRFFSGNTHPNTYWGTAFFNENNCIFLAVNVSEWHEHLLGVAECALENDTAEIALVVHPQHRGRGVGKQLLRAMETWADKNNITLRASVLPENVSMIRLLTLSWQEITSQEVRVFIRVPQTKHTIEANETNE